METRANYVLIGAFTLLGILASLGFFLWLAKVQVDKQYAYYDVLFTNVSGLGEAGDVRYNGLPVGQAVRLSLDDNDPSKVRVRIEIDAATPVKTDTKATLELQGVTGVSYVSLSGGTPEAPLLRDASDKRVPEIVADRSAVQSLFEGLPAIMDEAVLLLENLNEVAGPANREAVGSMLANLESASGKLDQALQDFSTLSADLSAASSTIANFTGRLDEVADSAITTLDTTDETLRTARVAIEKAQPMIDEATEALMAARQTLNSADSLMQANLPELIAQLDATAAAIETAVTELSGKADGVIGRIEQIGDRAITRLDQAEVTLAKLDTALDTATATMTAIGDTARSVDQLAKGDGAALVAEARQTLARVNTVVESATKVMTEDVTGIMTDIRSAIDKVRTTIDTASGNLTSATGKLDVIIADAQGTLAAATRTFESANSTLAAITKTLESAEGTLGAAEQTFTGVNRILDEDAEAIIADLRLTVGEVRTTVANLGNAVNTVSDDLPGITADLRETLTKASSFVGRLDGLVLNNSEQIETFMQAGLPQFVRFVQEGSRLIANLQRLTAKIESNPARFLLGTQTPDFKE